ncbi:MAG: tetratricopeptide repeat protein [Imperialibacter sp.]
MNQPILKKIFTTVGVLGSLYFLYQRYERSNQESEIKFIANIYYSGDLDSCEVLLLGFTESNPTNYRGWTFLGNVYLENDRDTLAEHAYLKSIEFQPNDAQALTGLGVIARIRKNYGEAEKYYEEAIEADPKYAHSYSSLLVLKIIDKKYEEAVQFGEKASELNPEALGIAGNLALAYHYSSLTNKRDSLFAWLEQHQYKDLLYLKMVTDGLVNLEDLL